MQGQIARDLAGLLARDRDRPALEAGLRKPGHVEPVGAAQVLLELRQVEVDAGGVDQHRQVRRLRLLGIEVERALEAVEAADEFGKTEVVELDQQRSVLRIEPVGAGRQLFGREGLVVRGQKVPAGGEREREPEAGERARGPLTERHDGYSRSVSVSGWCFDRRA